MVDKKLLEQRIAAKKRKPTFSRQDSHKKVKLGTAWRRPKGLQSKMRIGFRSRKASVEVGYGSPVAVKGLHRSGLEICLVHNVAQLEALNAETQGALVASGVSQRSKVKMVQAATQKNITLLNVKDSTAFLKAVEDNLSKRKDAKKKKVSKAKEKEKEAKKAEKKDEKSGIDAAVSEEEKKVQEKKELDKVLTTKKQ